jgi:hypothetical protein
MIYGRNIWGPKAWHLLHVFSINNNSKISEAKKHNYFIFYNSFSYLIPCLVCSEHYSNIVKNIYPLNEKKINRKYLIKWVYNVHNIVNEIIHKPKYSYNKFIENNIVINHNDIFFIIYTMYSEIDYKNISLYKYDQIYNFFINFCLLYPEKSRRIKLKKIISSETFKKLVTPKEFDSWFKDNIKNIKEIIIEN